MHVFAQYSHQNQTTLLFLVLKQCHLQRVIYINNTLLSLGWMGMWCWLRRELPDLYLFEKFPHFPHGVSERWRGSLYQWRLAHQIAADHQRSWIIPVKVPGKWQFESVPSSFCWYAYAYGHYSRGMIYQSLMEKIKLWKGLFPLVVWSVDGVTVTHAFVFLKCFDTWVLFLLTFFLSSLFLTLSCCLLNLSHML